MMVGQMEEKAKQAGWPAGAITVSIFDIDESDNPRQSENPAWRSLKDSIEAVGLKSVLVVRQVGERYRLARGGNTRLRILKELVAEGRGDLRYITVMVDRAEPTRATVAVDHLIENDLRGAMSYSDRAVAIRRIKDQLEEEHGGILSVRTLERALRQYGYPLGRTAVANYVFAAEELIPRMGPLREQLTQRMAIELRGALGALRTLWAAYERDGSVPEGQWSQMVSDAFAQKVVDGEISARGLADELCDIIGDMADVDRNKLKEELGEVRAGKAEDVAGGAAQKDAVPLLRERCAAMAAAIAKRGGLPGQTLAIDDGLGFLVGAPPAGEGGNSDEARCRQTETWLYLAAQSGVFDAPGEAIARWIDGGSPLLNIISERRYKNIPVEACSAFDNLPAIGVMQAVELWRADSEMFRLRRELEDGCRALRAELPDVWGEQS